MAKKPENHGKSWTPQQEKQLKQMAEENTPTRVMALKLGRTEDSVRSKSGGNTPCKQTGLKVEFSTKEEESSAMKQSRFTDSQIMAILKQVENGLAVPDVCREHGISVPTFYKWRAKFGGMDASLIARMKELEAENARLKKMYIETQIKNDLLSEALGKKP